MHLAELPKADVLDAMLPGLGIGWRQVLAGSMNHIFQYSACYAAEWEAVTARWANDDHALLQPTMPSWLFPLTYAVAMVKQTVAKKELEL